MKTSPTFVSSRAGNLAILPFLTVVDSAPDLIATGLLVVAGLIFIALSCIFAVRRPSPNQKFALDLLSKLAESQDQPATKERRAARRMVA